MKIEFILLNFYKGTFFHKFLFRFLRFFVALRCSEILLYPYGFTVYFKELLDTLSNIKGKFLLSSYPNEILDKSVHEHGWHTKSFNMRISVNAKEGKKNQRNNRELYDLKWV